VRLSTKIVRDGEDVHGDGEGCSSQGKGTDHSIIREAHQETEVETLGKRAVDNYFLNEVIILALYHDLFNVGYDQLIEETFSWYHASSKTLQHNTKLIRLTAGDWGKRRIHLGKLADWKAARRRVSLKKGVEDVSLWLESMDAPMEGKSRIKRFSAKWSFKCAGPGRRYMVLSDGKGRKIWGGYSPKVYDSHLIEANRDWFEDQLKGAEVVADQHFRWGVKHMTHVRFHVAHRQSRVSKQGKKNSKELSEKKQKKYNAAVHDARARVDTIFGILKKKKYWPTPSGKTRTNWMQLSTSPQVSITFS